MTNETKTKYSDVKLATSVEKFYNEHWGIKGTIKDNQICPFCHSGTGANHTPAFHIYNDQTAVCYSCDISPNQKSTAKARAYDIFDLAGAYLNSDNKKEQYEYIVNWAHITDNKPIIKKDIAPKEQAQTKREQKDYTKFFEYCKSNNDYKYLSSRGISKATQILNNIGLAKQFTMDGQDAQCVIIPRSKYSFTARNTNLNCKENARVKKCGESNLYLPPATPKDQLKNNVIFIVEGEIDALSLFDNGYTAIALGSTKNHGLLSNYAIKNKSNNACYVLMLDNDQSGQDAQKDLHEQLNNNAIINFCVNLAPYNDVNEWLTKNKESFINNLSAIEQQGWELHEKINQKIKEVATMENEIQPQEKDKQQEVENKQENIQQDEKQDKENKSNNNPFKVESIVNWWKEIEKRPAKELMKTGFKWLDDDPDGNYFGGGLDTGFYVIGAPSNIGKTTFCLQMASQISKQGTQTAYFCMEMNKEILTLKGISRWTYQLNPGVAKTTNELKFLNHWQHFGDYEKKNIYEAMEKYKDEGNNLRIYDYKSVSVDDIRNVLQQGCKCVFIDYFQIMDYTGDEQNQSELTRIKQTAKDLESLSVEFDAVIIAISSLSNESIKNNNAQQGFFKGSGDIQYSADITLLLKYTYDENTARLQRENKEPINITLQCIKNRQGGIWRRYLLFNGKYNIFTSDDELQEKVKTQIKKNIDENEEKKKKRQQSKSIQELVRMIKDA